MLNKGLYQVPSLQHVDRDSSGAAIDTNVLERSKRPGCSQRARGAAGERKKGKGAEERSSSEGTARDQAAELREGVA